jgi:hypothetical protein
MTSLQRLTLSRVHTATYAKRWYRASSSGERVTLASLFKHGALERRAWRTGKSVADNAYEYTLARTHWPDVSLAALESETA